MGGMTSAYIANVAQKGRRRRQLRSCQPPGLKTKRTDGVARFQKSPGLSTRAIEPANYIEGRNATSGAGAGAGGVWCVGGATRAA